MKSTIPRIYPITDTKLSGLSHAEQVRKLIAGGAELIQLREKVATPLEFYESAKVAIQMARRHQVKIIINDRVDIALATKADGVHLGQDDMPPEQARKLLGPAAIIGYSTHSVDQAIAAASMQVDYIAIGPIHETQTKENADPAVGLEGIRSVRDAIGDIPLVAIGGINEEDLFSVFAAGADSAAVVGAIIGTPHSIDKRMKHFIELAGLAL
ncbi:thiamine phosphate synthase [soil metagenome]